MDVYRFNHSHTLAYALYDPKPDHPIPLIVWLHGAGEGGIDPRVVLLGNPAFRLKEPPIQDAFGQAMVLYPQSPTFWMDDGKQKYTTSGQSIYAQSVFGLIDRTVRNNRFVDPDRVYIGGNSNGGFMTIRLLLDHPGYFAGAFPICEAFADQWLLESDIRQLQQEAIWFTVASNDRVVDPEHFTLATYRRIKQDPISNCHLSLFDGVVDPTGKYVGSRNEPFEYGGHAVWISALAGRSTALIDKKAVEMFLWLATQNNRSRR
jgi:predicted peptidase